MTAENANDAAWDVVRHGLLWVLDGRRDGDRSRAAALALALGLFANQAEACRVLGLQPTSVSRAKRDLRSAVKAKIEHARIRREMGRPSSDGKIIVHKLRKGRNENDR